MSENDNPGFSRDKLVGLTSSCYFLPAYDTISSIKDGWAILRKGIPQDRIWTFHCGKGTDYGKIYEAVKSKIEASDTLTGHIMHDLHYMSNGAMIKHKK